MSRKLLLLAVMLLAMTSLGMEGCTLRTKILATNAVLDGRPKVIPMETPLDWEGTALELCVEPSNDFERGLDDSFKGFFRDANGNEIQILGESVAADGHRQPWRPSSFALQINKTCFSINKSHASEFDEIHVTASHPITLDRLYWEWSLYH